MTDSATVIYTVGHSTHSFEAFVALLKTARVAQIADVRRFPASRRYPHFNREALETALAAQDIAYQWFPDLGGRRKANPHSHNTAWRNESFRGYADYMETAPFQAALGGLKNVAMTRLTALLCAESLWWQCHRGLIADALKAEGWDVRHILTPSKVETHPYTSAASLHNGRLSYRAPDLFSDGGG